MFKSSLFNRLSVCAKPNQPKQSTQKSLFLETLEDRRVLASYVVDTLDDVVAADGLVSLREAITAANSNATINEAPAGNEGPGNVDSIQFAPSLDGGVLSLELGTLPITDALQIFDNNPVPLIVDGQQNQIFNIDSRTGSVSIADLGLENGSANLGGAIYVASRSQLSLSHVTVQSNRANDGGGIYNDGGTISILSSTLRDNIADAESGSGGAIFSASGIVSLISSEVSFNAAIRAGGGIEVAEGTLSLLRSTLLQNDVSGSLGAANPGNGGGIHITGAAETHIVNSFISGNQAGSEGGGLWNQVGGTMNIHNTVIFENEAFGATSTEGGGGIFNNGGVVNITGADTLISDNFASGTSGSGGGLFNDLGGELNITDATITGNVANRAGGGIEAVAGTTTNLTDVILSENNAGVGPDAVAAPGNGGGLHITGAGDATIVGGEVDGNVAASEGGGLWNGTGTLVVDGTLIVGNTASGAAADEGGGGIFNAGGILELTATEITSNTADGVSGSGGGLLNVDGSVTLIGTVVSFNSANRAGGGIEVINGTVLVTDSNLVSNDVNGLVGTPSPGNGGGLHVSGNNALVTLDGGSVFGNEAASEGGGLWNQVGSTLTVQNGTVIGSNEAFRRNIY